MTQGSWHTHLGRILFAATGLLLATASTSRGVTLTATKSVTGYSPTQFVEGFVDVYVSGVASSETLKAYEVALSIAPAGADVVFSGASATALPYPPILPGAGPTVVGALGNGLQVVDYPNAALSEGVGLVRARYRAAPGVQGTYAVNFEASFTNLANQLGQPIAIGQLVAGEITIGDFLRGDVDLDDVVGLGDFGIFKLHFGQPGGRSEGDLNGDGFVGVADFNLLKASFGETANGTSSMTVPEPSALALMLGGLVAAGLAVHRGISVRHTRR
jgi:hypothetical protein